MVNYWKIFKKNELGPNLVALIFYSGKMVFTGANNKD